MKAVAKGHIHKTIKWKEDKGLFALCDGAWLCTLLPATAINWPKEYTRMSKKYTYLYMIVYQKAMNVHFHLLWTEIQSKKKGKCNFHMKGFTVFMEIRCNSFQFQSYLEKLWECLPDLIQFRIHWNFNWKAFIFSRLFKVNR